MEESERSSEDYILPEGYTKEIPDEPGLYWLTSDHSYVRGKNPEVVEVERNE